MIDESDFSHVDFGTIEIGDQFTIAGQRYFYGGVIRRPNVVRHFWASVNATRVKHPFAVPGKGLPLSEELKVLHGLTQTEAFQAELLLQEFNDQYAWMDGHQLPYRTWPYGVEPYDDATAVTHDALGRRWSLATGEKSWATTEDEEHPIISVYSFPRARREL